MLRLLLILTVALGVASTVVAGENPDIGIALHVQPVGEDCDTHGVSDCFEIVTQWMSTGESLDFFVFVCGHGWTPGSEGFMSARYGLVWPEEWLFVAWRTCVTFPHGTTNGTIAHPGDCVYQEFLACQPALGQPVPVGILTLLPMSPGAVAVIPHGETCTAEVGDCMMGIDVVLPTPLGNGRAGWATVGMLDPGCNPCPCVGEPCYTSLGENPDAAIALHCQEPGGSCDDHGILDCFSIVTAASGTFLDFYVFVCGQGWNPASHGFRTAQYSLAWTENLNFIDWQSCADYTYGAIHQEGDGVYQGWYDCIGPVGPVAAGILSLFATGPGRVSVFEHPVAGWAGVGDCIGGANIVYPLSAHGNGRAGWVDVNMVEGVGCNPCPCVGPPCYSTTAVPEKDGDTWSHVKSLFR